jgi:hypothetical protein
MKKILMSIALVAAMVAASSCCCCNNKKAQEAPATECSAEKCAGCDKKDDCEKSKCCSDACQEKTDCKACDSTATDCCKKAE